MKQRSREINVFSVSALDLFASALGAFILMSLIFMVFFSMNSQDPGDADALQASLLQCETRLAGSVDAADLAVCEAQLSDSVNPSDLAMCEAQLAGAVDASELAQCEAQLAASASASDLAMCEAQLSSAGQAEQELQMCQRALQQTFLLVIASWSSSDDVDLHVLDPMGREYYYADRSHAGSPAALEEDNTRGPGNEVWLHPSAEAGRYRVCYKLFSGQPSPTVRGSVLWQEGQIDVPELRLTAGGQVRVAIDINVDDNGIVTVDRSRSQQVLGSGGCG